MTTFDDIIPEMKRIFQSHRAGITHLAPLMINRDLNGRVRLLVNERWENDADARRVLTDLANEIYENLVPHAYPADRALLFESDVDELDKEIRFPLYLDEPLQWVYVVDRLATEGNWSSIDLPSSSVPRIVYYSIKGGVGRSTALAVTAWALSSRESVC